MYLMRRIRLDAPSKKQLACLWARLLNQQSRLQRRLAALCMFALAEIRDRSEAPNGTADLDRDTAQAAAEAMAESLRRIAEAFDRMAEGTYGFCKECGSRIPYDRLDMNTAACLCLQCERSKKGQERQVAELKTRWELPDPCNTTASDDCLIWMSDLYTGHMSESI